MLNESAMAGAPFSFIQYVSFSANKTCISKAGNIQVSKVKTMVVTEFVQDQLLTLETAPDERQVFRESYRIEVTTESSCRVHFTIQVGNVPKVAEFFMCQSMKKEQPRTAYKKQSVRITHGRCYLFDRQRLGGQWLVLLHPDFVQLSGARTSNT